MTKDTHRDGQCKGRDHLAATQASNDGMYNMAELQQLGAQVI